MSANQRTWLIGIVAAGCNLAVACGIALVVSHQTAKDRDAALANYRANAHVQSEMAAEAAGTALDNIYMNLRTMTLLASVRKIDRHGESLTDDGRQAIQQLFNNLAGSVDVSEVYVVPADLDPEKVDPKTNQPQAPILMFDKVRLGIAGSEPEETRDPSLPEQVEIYEYRELRDLMTKLRTEAPKLIWKTGAEIPLYTLPSVITCDNSAFDKTRKDPDRTGPIFSVPFYDEQDNLKGTVSAIMLNSAVAKMLPDENFALIDSASHNVFGSPKGGQQVVSAARVIAGQPDESLFYSEVIEAPTSNPGKGFKLWAGRPNAEFLSDPTMVKIDEFARLGYACAVAVCVLGFAILTLVLRSFASTARAEAVLRQRLEEKAAEVHALVAEQSQSAMSIAEERRRRESEQAAAEQADRQATVVSDLARGLERLADGDLVQSLDRKFAPEYEKLRADFNSAVGQLRGVMTEVTGSARRIYDASGEINSAATDLAQRTGNQAASLKETAAALNEVAESVARTAEGAAHARTIAASAQEDAKYSETVVHNAADAMHEIREASSRIGQIVGVIDEIALQTNLLAVNAGVEAARAGESGRGFAIVASEVRSLAKRSAESAREIRKLIAASSAQVGHGVELVGQTGHALERVMQWVGKINEIADSIARATADQAKTIANVSSSARDMDRVTQENARRVAETSQASDSLLSETEQLSHLIDRFKVGEGRVGTAREAA